MVHRAPRLLLLALVLAALPGCDDAVGPAVRLELRGAVSQGGAPLPGARVILLDRRSTLEAGVVLGSATADGAGRYALDTRAERPGYIPGCDFLVLYVEGFQYATTMSAPVRCVPGVQTIDLVAEALPAAASPEGARR